MANIGFTVNTEELPDAQDFSPVPAGTGTTGMIVKSQLLPTNQTKKVMPEGVDYETYLKTNPKASGFLNIEIDIQDGPSAGRKLFHNFNLVNDSDKAVEIAFGQLKQLLSGLGMKQWSGKSEELHNKRFKMDHTVEQGKDYVKDGQTIAGKPQAVIKKFYAATGAVANNATAPATQAAATGATPPWKR